MEVPCLFCGTNSSGHFYAQSLNELARSETIQASKGHPSIPTRVALLDRTRGLPSSKRGKLFPEDNKCEFSGRPSPAALWMASYHTAQEWDDIIASSELEPEVFVNYEFPMWGWICEPQARSNDVRSGHIPHRVGSLSKYKQSPASVV